MFLSKLFKHTRARVMTALAGLTMVLGVGAAIAATTTQNQNEVVETKAGTNNWTSKTIFVRNSVGWSNVYLHAWDSDGNITGDWPGKAMSSYNKTYGAYRYYTTSKVPTALLFHNNSGSQTSDIDFAGTDHPFYYVNSTDSAGATAVTEFAISGGSSYQMTWDPTNERFSYTTTLESGVSFYLHTGLRTSGEYSGQNNEVGGGGTNYSTYIKTDGNNWQTKDRCRIEVLVPLSNLLDYGNWSYGVTINCSAVPSYTVAIARNNTTYGTVSTSSISVVSGTSYSVSSNVLTIGNTEITATPTSQSAQYTYGFSNWTIGGTPITSGTITAATTITANFTRATRTYTITINRNNTTYGTVSASSVASVPYGTSYSVSTNTLTIGSTTVTATPSSNTSQYTYAFSNWTTGGATATSGTITGATTFTANFTRTAVNYNLTYKYLDVDSNTIKTASTTTTGYGTTVTLPTPSVSGYQFVSWYESDGFGGTARDAGYKFNMPASAKTFTAKFERIGFYLVDTGNGFVANASSYGSGGAGVWTWNNVSLKANDMLKIRYIGSAHSYEDSGWLGYNRLSSSSLAYSNFTQVVGGDDNNNIKATAAGTFDIRFEEGANDAAGAIYIDWHPEHTQGYYVVGDSTFTGGGTAWSVTTGVLLSHTPSGSDLAAGTNITVPAGSKFAVMKYVDGHNDVWYHSWGDYPTSCETYTDEHSKTNLHYKGSSAASFNFYLNKDGAIFIVDQTVIAAAGYLYYSSDSADDEITLTVTNINDENPINSGHLSDVADVVLDNKVSEFDGHDNLYKIPFYNLRGNMVTAKIKTITIAGFTINVSATTQDDSKDYYIYGTSCSETKGAAAKAVFDLDTAMNGKSICDMSASWASLKSSIEAGYTGDATLMSGAKILTCASKGDKKTFTTEWNVSDIYKEICRQLGVATGIPAWPLSSFIIPGGPKGNESPLTLTLWIVLGCGLLGLGAIGTAYFVSKKKKHQA